MAATSDLPDTFCIIDPDGFADGFSPPWTPEQESMFVIFYMPITPGRTMQTLDKTLLSTGSLRFLSKECNIFLKTLKLLSKNIIFCQTKVVKAKTHNSFSFHPFALKLLLSPNLSDTSRLSEAFSLHVMINLLRKRLGLVCSSVITETEIEYVHDNLSKTDYILVFDDNTHKIKRIAVEVKRMMKRSFKGVITTFDDVVRLLEKTNEAAHISNNNMCDSNAWNMQILHILTDSLDICSFVAKWLVEKPLVDIAFERVVITVVNNNRWMF